jgi:hypothetical protein
MFYMPIILPLDSFVESYTHILSLIALSLYSATKPLCSANSYGGCNV